MSSSPAFEEARSRLRRVVRRAVEHDVVRMHGGIVAAFEIYGAETAEQDVFAAARRSRLPSALTATRWWAGPSAAMPSAP